ncbi:MAG: hypothetical protein WBI14_04750 [Anaerolineaceae bacterium]
MNDLISLEQLLQNELIDSKPNQLFKSTLRQKLLDRSALKRKKLIDRWLAFTLTGVVVGITLYGVAAIIKKSHQGQWSGVTDQVPEGSS